jgi:CBS domain containing-hemolysin-like protein
MMLPTVVVIFVVLVCLAGQAFFSGSEMAMVSADRMALRTKADGGDSGAELSLQLLAREDRLLGTCLIGTNLTLVTGTTLIAVLLGWWHIELGLGAALIYTPVALIFGEALSKTVFQFHANRLAPVVARPLRVAQLLFLPALVVVGVWSRALDALLGRGKREPVRREEIVDLLGEDGGGGEIDDDERRMIRNVFVLSETPVDEVMTPLVDVTALRHDATVADATAAAGATGHSRLPVYEERIDNIVGVVHVRALLFEDDPDAPILPLMEPVVFVPESKRVDDLLTEMRQRRDPLAVVVDEYGGSVGLVTIEDLLEEVIGEIRDERDADEPDIQRLSEREWRVPARTEIDELTDALEYEFPEGDYETIAGMVLAAAGRIPVVGETVTVGPVAIIIEDANDRAILCVRVLLPPS